MQDPFQYERQAIFYKGYLVINKGDRSVMDKEDSFRNR